MGELVQDDGESLASPLWRPAELEAEAAAPEMGDTQHWRAASVLLFSRAHIDCEELKYNNRWVRSFGLHGS